MLSHFYDEALIAPNTDLSSTFEVYALVSSTSKNFRRNCFNSFPDSVHQPVLRSCQNSKSVMVSYIYICEFIPRVL